MFIKSKWGPVYHNLDLSMSLLFHPSREGEFTVEVLAFNNISSAVLRKPLFIVHEPCQPPPVKNMGPKKVQVGLFWRNHLDGLAIGCFQTAELAGKWRGLCWVCPAVFSTMKSLWGLWSGVPKQGKPGLGGRPGFYWVNKSFIYPYDWRWAQLALSSFFLFFLFWLYTEWWHFQSKGKSTPKWKEMTNYMLSTKYRAEKKIQAAFYFFHSFEGFDFKQFYFQVKGVQPDTWESKFAAEHLPKYFLWWVSCQPRASQVPAASECSGLQREYGVALGRLWLSGVHVPGGKTFVALEASIPWCQPVLCPLCEGWTKMRGSRGRPQLTTLQLEFLLCGKADTVLCLI